jgi:hypothetical protein
MMQKSAENSQFNQPEILTPAETNPLCPGGDNHQFAIELRALGQALEKFNLSGFDLQIERRKYMVSGREPVAEAPKASFARFLRSIFLGERDLLKVAVPTNQLLLSYTFDEVKEFDCRGRTKREDGSGMPDPYSLSQILRGVGCYLDKRKGSSLLSVGIRDRWVTIAFRAPNGELEKAHQDFEYFYNYWVKMYTQRSNRPKLPPPSDPTVFVAWEGALQSHKLNKLAYR